MSTLRFHLCNAIDNELGRHLRRKKSQLMAAMFLQTRITVGHWLDDGILPSAALSLACSELVIETALLSQTAPLARVY